ncbi:MAG TPA: hypothetical protein VN843_01715, partial [Anaerolineales bacterium]|nr:hypothetical protein [Anaerolineales bacterium]
FEIAPEHRHNPQALTADEARAYAERPYVKAALAAHPDVKLGWDTTTQGPELNIGASTDNLETAKKIAGKLDQRAIVNTKTGQEIPVGGKGERTSFPEYPLADRLKDLNAGRLEKSYPKDEEDNPVWEKLTPEQMSQAVKDSAYATYSLDDVKEGSPWLSETDEKEGKTPAIKADHGSEAGFLHPDGSMSMIGDSFLHDVFSKEIGLENPDLLKKAGIGTYDIWSAPHGGNHTGIAFDLAAPPTQRQIQAIAALTKHMREGEPETFQSVNVTWPGGEKGIEFPTPGKVVQALKDVNVGKLEKAAPKEEEGFGFGANAAGTADEQKGIISTAVPSGKNAIANPHEEYTHVGMNTVTPETMKKIADRVREMPGFKYTSNVKDPEKVVNQYVEQAKNNLKYLYNSVPEETRDAHAKWYESANKIADRLSTKYGKTTKQGAGVLAALSPQKDWNMNVGLAERLMDIYHTKKNESLSPGAKAKGKELGLGGLVGMLGDNKLGDLTEPLAKAAFIRLWDEAHNDRSFKEVDPATGDYKDFVKNDAGENYRIAWGNMNEIAKAVSILEDGSRENISKNLGMSHKVRSFYNNVLD